MSNEEKIILIEDDINEQCHNITPEEPKEEPKAKDEQQEETEKNIFSNFIKMYFPNVDIKFDRTFETPKELILYLFQSEHREEIFPVSQIPFCICDDNLIYKYRDMDYYLDILFEAKKEYGILTHESIIKNINKPFEIDHCYLVKNVDEYYKLRVNKVCGDLKGLDVGDSKCGLLYEILRIHGLISRGSESEFYELKEKYTWYRKLTGEQEEEPEEEEEEIYPNLDWDN